MIPMRDQHLLHSLQRDLVGVQHFIQARLATEEPYLLSVNPMQVAEYEDELQHYVKQKQRQQQLRRPLPLGSAAAGRSAPAPTSSASFHASSSTAMTSPAAARSAVSMYSHPSATNRPSRPRASVQRGPRSTSVVPTRLPGVEWLLAKSHPHGHGNCSTTTDPHEGFHAAPSIPCRPVLPAPYMHGFAPHPGMHHRGLKKQKTM